MSDFRVDTVFFRHNKTKLLKRMLGWEGVVALMKLWAYASDCKYDGDHVFTADDIELAVDWDGEPGALVAALGSEQPYIRFIDPVDGGYVIHDWEEHNAYAATAGTRTDAARNAANARWKKRRGVSSDAAPCPGDNAHDADNDAGNGTHDAGAYAQHNAKHAPGNAPSPSPSPVPSPSTKEINALCSRSPPEPVPAPAGAAQAHGKKFDQQKWFEKFWDAFNDKRGRSPALIAWRRIKGLDKQLAEVIVAKAGLYAQQRKDILARNGTPKMAQGWINDRRWEDDTAAVVGTAQGMSPDLSAAFSKVLEGNNGHDACGSV